MLLDTTHPSNAPKTVLAVDDNEDALFALEAVLEESGYRVLTARNGEEAYSKAAHTAPHAILLDVSMPELNGHELLERLKAHRRLQTIPVIFVSACDEDREILTGLDLGAVDYVTKPYNPALLMARLRAALRNQPPVGKVATPRTAPEIPELVGTSAQMQSLRELVLRIAPTTAPVLISGPTGTGKELTAQHLHLRSARAEQQFIARNCAAFPETLAESELFGHVRGAFTGAVRDQKGVFEIADGGTLFLDEVGELSLSLQAKLLRVLQEGIVTPIGSPTEKQVDVRLIAATNRDLRKMVANGQFREDLFYRLNVIHLELPFLHERQEDIPLLVNAFLKEEGRVSGRQFELTIDALEKLSLYPWPGNIRELRNELERAMILAANDLRIDLSVISDHIVRYQSETRTTADGSLRTALAECEQRLIAQTLRETGGNKSLAARRLGMSRTSLIEKANRYGLSKSSPS